MIYKHPPVILKFLLGFGLLSLVVVPLQVPCGVMPICMVAGDCYDLGNRDCPQVDPCLAQACVSGIGCQCLRHLHWDSGDFSQQPWVPDKCNWGMKCVCDGSHVADVDYSGCASCECEAKPILIVVIVVPIGLGCLCCLCSLIAWNRGWCEIFVQKMRRIRNGNRSSINAAPNMAQAELEQVRHRTNLPVTNSAASSSTNAKLVVKVDSPTAPRSPSGDLAVSVAAVSAPTRTVQEHRRKQHGVGLYMANSWVGGDLGDADWSPGTRVPHEAVHSSVRKIAHEYPPKHVAVAASPPRNDRAKLPGPGDAHQQPEHMLTELQKLQDQVKHLTAVIESSSSVAPVPSQSHNSTISSKSHLIQIGSPPAYDQVDSSVNHDLDRPPSLLLVPEPCRPHEEPSSLHLQPLMMTPPVTTLINVSSASSIIYANPSTQPSTGSPPPSYPQVPKFCTNCGSSRVGVIGLFCPNCGHRAD